MARDVMTEVLVGISGHRIPHMSATYTFTQLSSWAPPFALAHRGGRKLGCHMSVYDFTSPNVIMHHGCHVPNC